jgi:hypothetical protein
MEEPIHGIKQLESLQKYAKKKKKACPKAYLSPQFNLCNISWHDKIIEMKKRLDGVY